MSGADVMLAGERALSGPGVGELEALIREARRRQRRRWARRVLSLVALAGLVAAGMVVLDPGAGSSALHGPRRSGAAVTGSAGARLGVAGPLALASVGVLYIADVGSDRVLARLPDGRLRVIAGSGREGFSGDRGSATRADLFYLTGIAVSATGSVYIADGGRVRVIDRAGVIRTIAGDGRPVPTGAAPGPIPGIAAGTPALSAAFGSPQEIMAGQARLAIALGPRGGLYIATREQILRLTARGTLVPVRAIVNSGPKALRGPLREIGSIAVDQHGHIDVAAVDTITGQAIWQLSATGTATPIVSSATGDYQSLQRGPDGAVYTANGTDVLRIVKHSLKPAYAFPNSPRRDLWPEYFAGDPADTLYADGTPSGAMPPEQLVSVHGDHETLLWQQPPLHRPSASMMASTISTAARRLLLCHARSKPARRGGRLVCRG